MIVQVTCLALSYLFHLLQAQELSQKLRIYTKGGPKQEDGSKAQQWFWPLVKSVTVRVPHNELLQHVTLVDLPGNGDRNKSRNEMWKQVFYSHPLHLVLSCVV